MQSIVTENMTLDTQLGIGGAALGVLGLVVGLAGFAVAYFSITSEWARRRRLHKAARAFPPMFKTLATQYRSANAIQDRDARVREKDDVGRALTYFALGADMSREAIASVGDEAYLVALAGMARAAPRSGDAALLVTASRVHAHPHAHYQVTAAIKKLVESKLVRHEDLQGLLKMLGDFRSASEPKDHAHLDATSALLQNVPAA